MVPSAYRPTTMRLALRDGTVEIDSGRSPGQVPRLAFSTALWGIQFLKAKVMDCFKRQMMPPGRSEKDGQKVSNWALMRLCLSWKSWMKSVMLLFAISGRTREHGLSVELWMHSGRVVMQNDAMTSPSLLRASDLLVSPTTLAHR